MTVHFSGTLLEYLKECTKVNFISDLCFLNREKYQLLRNGIEQISYGLYSLSEWNDAILYILHQQSGFSTESQARDFLLEHFQ